jgi:RHS repeat-associated protein
MLPIHERDSNNVVQVTYTRGLDLSLSLSGAGGIGGLLARTDANGSTFYHADGSGNVTALIDGNQNIVARYEYDPFGKLIGKWGPLADANTYRFSSKEFQRVSGLYAYGYRFYEPTFQRWLNRDPIQEAGGMNLYGFVGNDSVNHMDSLGLLLTAEATVAAEPTLLMSEEETAAYLARQATRLAVQQAFQQAAEAQAQAEAAALIKVAAAAAGISLLVPSDSAQSPFPELEKGIILKDGEWIDSQGNIYDKDHNLIRDKNGNGIIIEPCKKGPAPNGGDAPNHGGEAHNQAILDFINSLPPRAQDIRKNQWQVGFDGNIIGNNRPDLQYNLDGHHYNVEFDYSVQNALNHLLDIQNNDPSSRIILHFLY